jgi:hypothetical protein
VAPAAVAAAWPPHWPAARHVAARPIAAELLAAATAAAVARTETVLTPGRLTNRELGNRTLRRLLTFGTRQRCTDEPAMRRTLVLDVTDIIAGVAGIAIGVRFSGRGDRNGLGGLRRLRSDRLRRFAVTVIVCGAIIVLIVCGRGRWLRVVRDAFWSVSGDLRIQRGGRVVLLALPRHFRVLVFVFGVAGGATRLFDVLTDEGHDGVVGHTPLARTVVVQNVSKPKLTLLH